MGVLRNIIVKTPYCRKCDLFLAGYLEGKDLLWLQCWGCGRRTPVPEGLTYTQIGNEVYVKFIPKKEEDNAA